MNYFYAIGIPFLITLFFGSLFRLLWFVKKYIEGSYNSSRIEVKRMVSDFDNSEKSQEIKELNLKRFAEMATIEERLMENWLSLAKNILTAIVICFVVIVLAFCIGYITSKNSF